MKLVYETPILVSETKAGQKKFWQGVILQDGSKFYRQAITWRMTNSGVASKQLISEPYEIVPKNIGRANATTAKEQALLEMDARVKKQQDKGYVKPGEKSKILPLPMLANKWKDKKHKVVYPAYVQPKLDGMRMLYDGKKAWSRGGKLILEECIAHLKFDTLGYTVDGELILEGNHALQETMEAAKKFHPESTPHLEYHIFDIMDSTMTFEERYNVLSSMIFGPGSRPGAGVLKQIHVVPTFTLSNESGIKDYHRKFVKAGYEGIIVRNKMGLYLINHRSSDLLKYKEFVDSEFKIVDVEEGGGKFKGTAIFVCVNKEGVKFRATPEGDMESRKKMYTHRKELIGQWLTVRYQTLTKERVPQFPIAIAIREKGEF